VGASRLSWFIMAMNSARSHFCSRGFAAEKIPAFDAK